MKQKFYICKHCGNLVAMIRDAGVPILCCGEKMHEIKPGTTEASGEKHIPSTTWMEIPFMSQLDLWHIL